MPIVAPNIAPARMSVGKCTNKYILENAIIQVRIRAIVPSFLSSWKITKEAITEDVVCPDGNE